MYSVDSQLCSFPRQNQLSLIIHCSLVISHFEQNSNFTYIFVYISICMFAFYLQRPISKFTLNYCTSWKRGNCAVDTGNYQLNLHYTKYINSLNIQILYQQNLLKNRMKCASYDIQSSYPPPPHPIKTHSHTSLSLSLSLSLAGCLPFLSPCPLSLLYPSYRPTKPQPQPLT